MSFQQRIIIAIGVIFVLSVISHFVFPGVSIIDTFEGGVQGAIQSTNTGTVGTLATNVVNQDERTIDSYLPNYILDVQRRCQPGEIDTERYCIKKGCPDGMEQGTGAGKELCFVKCLDGYDSNGMSRCFKRCPPGFKSADTSCVNPGHKFKKDIVPCRGCLDHVPRGPQEMITELERGTCNKPVGPVVMAAQGSYAMTLDPLIDVEYLTGRVYGDVRAEAITEYFDGTATGAPAPALVETPTVTINMSGEAQASRIDNLGQPCPRGYTLSGNMCYENCPPHYRDTQDGYCVKAGYTIDRDSYDRGAGVPYITQRPKFEQIFRSY